MIVGGEEYVWAAYGVTWFVLLSYGWLTWKNYCLSEVELSSAHEEMKL